VILELKFDDRAPLWMFDLVKIFNLRQDYGLQVLTLRLHLRAATSA
jgi:hypothetical protein